MTLSHTCIAIADDLTGALEIGAKFADQGLPATIATDFRSLPRRACPVLVVDTETRHLSATEAAARTREVASFAREQSPQLIYKKTDSTLRGNIAAEFSGLQGVFPERRIVYVAAYPDMGRTVKGGRLFVHGRPVHETEFAYDRGSPVRDCSIRNVLGDVPAVVLDGECNADIEAAARSIIAEAPPQICAGPAAFAQALAYQMGSQSERKIPLPRAPRCLVVNGSLHPASFEQMALAREQALFDEDWKAFDEGVKGSGRERASQVGERVRRILAAARFDAVVVFGGDTAFGIHRALGSDPFEAIGEIAPGVAVSRSGDLLWVTKAGGFGPPDILATIRERLR
jgi:D-threonate/D-erythronate kinase